MSLHNRIMGLSIWTESQDFNKGYMDGVYDSGQIAKEADALMAEMAAVLESASVGAVVIDSAKDVLDNYDDWKERTK